MTQRWNARDAAHRYAEDEKFAEEFEAVLAELLQHQLRRIERIAKRAGVAAQADQLALARTAIEPSRLIASDAAIDGERVRAVLERSANKSGLTRGQIAKLLGVDSREPAIAQALRSLKEHGHLMQKGERRAARYSLRVARPRKSAE